MKEIAQKRLQQEEALSKEGGTKEKESLGFIPLIQRECLCCFFLSAIAK